MNNPPPAPGGRREGGGGGRFQAVQEGRVPRGVRAAVRDVAQARRFAEVQARLPRGVEAQGSLGVPPDQIADAYAAYSRSYWLRNGDDRRLAKNLLRWIEGEDGLAAWADEPVPPDLLGCDGEPLDMPGLAKADPEFAPLWRKVESRRSIVRSLLYDERPGASEDERGGEVRRRQALREVHGGVRGALRALPRDLRAAARRRRPRRRVG